MEKTFEFDVTLEDLLYANGVEGLNDILDSRMADRGIQHSATDIGYKVVRLYPVTEEGVEGLITIIATYVPDYMGYEDEDESEVDVDA